MSKQLAEALEERKGDRSLRALARELDVAVGTVEGWINGWRSPEIKYIAMLAVYLDVDPCLILKWEIAELNPEIVHSLNAPLSGRQFVDYGTYPTVRVYETTDRDYRPIDIHAEDGRIAA